MNKQFVKKKDGFEYQKAIIIPKSVLTRLCIKNDIIRNLYITDIGYYSKALNHYCKRINGADQNILIYCFEGKGTVEFKENVFQIEAGNFIIIPAKVAHLYYADNELPWTIYWIHFAGPGADALVQQLQHYKTFTGFGEEKKVIFDRVYNRLERGFSRENMIYSNLCFHQYLAEFVYSDKQLEENDKPGKDKIEEAIDFMRNNIEKALDLKEIAQAIYLSPSYFSALFKKKTGSSPIDYLNQLKIQETTQYLLFTNLRINEIALKIGISDPYYFSRLFAKIMGISPRKYRDKHPT